MTRINLVSPIELTDQHLVAEYREIFMIGPALQRSLKSKTWHDSKIPEKFTLNKGHVMFFYDKGHYLNCRYFDLIDEMKNRGMNPAENRIFPYWKFPEKYWYSDNFDWSPTDEDKFIVRERIIQRIEEKPGFYRYYGKKI